MFYCYIYLFINYFSYLIILDITVYNFGHTLF